METKYEYEWLVSYINRIDFLRADDPLSPQNLSSRILEYHTNSSTVEVMWKPPSNDSRVDFYQYQLIDNLTEVIVSNTTNTTAVLSGIPYNVNMSFVISAYTVTCKRSSPLEILVINIISKLPHNNIGCSLPFVPPHKEHKNVMLERLS